MNSLAGQNYHKKKFAKIVLNKNINEFVVYITFLSLRLRYLAYKV